jgi:hypothetical protein
MESCKSADISAQQRFPGRWVWAQWDQLLVGSTSALTDRLKSQIGCHIDAAATASDGGSADRKSLISFRGVSSARLIIGPVSIIHLKATETGKVVNEFSWPLSIRNIDFVLIVGIIFGIRLLC